MDGKIPVIIEPMQRTEYSFRNLDYCKQCGSYTTFRESSCLGCNGDNLISFENMINQMYKRRKKKDVLALLNIFLVTIILGGVIFPIKTQDLIISFVILMICLSVLILIQRKFSDRLRAFETHETIEKEGYKIRQSLEQDYQKITHDLEQHEYLEAYKALRNIGTIVKKQHIKTMKLHCLNKFIIRSDISLEMEELLLPIYHENLVSYIYELSKFQRSLIKQPTIEYIVQNEEYIQKDFPQADSVLGNIAGATCYSKRSLELNKDFIIRYIEYIPKDRMARIQKLVQSNTKYDWDTLQEAVFEMKGASYEER